MAQSARSPGNRLANKTAALTASAARVANASEVSIMFGSAALPFWAVQLIFGLIQISGVGAEYAGEGFLWGLGATFIPGQSLFELGYVITAFLGVLILLATAVAYPFFRVFWWRKIGVFVLILCMTLTVVPVLNIFPWFIFFLVYTVYAQK